MAENLVDFVDKSPIGVDHDQENEPLSSTRWMAEWSGAPTLPPRKAGSAGDRLPAAANVFFTF